MPSSRLFRLDLGRVHFGDDGLARSTMACGADTIFSALCIQALRHGGHSLLDRLVAAAVTGSLRLTDALPYCGDTFFAPKPYAPIPRADDPTSPSTKKAAKTISFVPVSAVGDFLAGTADLEILANAQAGIGVHGIADRASIHNGSDDAVPYRVGHFTFADAAGLWLFVSGSADELALVADLLTSLPAIGGERTSGYGSFTLSQVDAGQLPRLVGAGDASLAARFMSLTTALPSDAELDAALAGATYRLVRRSGFVASATYADTPLRKRDIYKLAAGSMFTSRFTGLVADVSNEGAHPVWSYAKPLFLPIQELS